MFGGGFSIFNSSRKRAIRCAESELNLTYLKAGVKKIHSNQYFG